MLWMLGVVAIIVDVICRFTGPSSMNSDLNHHKIPMDPLINDTGIEIPSTTEEITYIVMSMGGKKEFRGTGDMAAVEDEIALAAKEAVYETLLNEPAGRKIIDSLIPKKDYRAQGKENVDQATGEVDVPRQIHGVISSEPAPQHILETMTSTEVPSVPK